ncbi:hypothetical protein TH61_10405 [Rufibacter sp. DG15C]|uniref:DUF2851 family protein n=1 Tax=Rufibacter sp. DG15C TaxID=1379909 RepID=UPI00078D6695|nr:DUF2851 family protein [Rufibacter sp. DG15C]AMM52888.1 hypothetical protein TH61_10405 [Rufibacter sp. DG15C]
MKEDFLHYVWQHQYFNKEQLLTTTGEEITILHPGFYNRSDAGPDFSSARIKLDETEWVGSVEIHLSSSDWRRHHHQRDAKYNQVVLHVVWQEDEVALREEGTPMPTLELQGRVQLPLQAQYQELLWSEAVIPCAPQTHLVDGIYKSSMLDKTLLERLQLKAELVLERMEQSRQNWESTVYQTMAAGFGFKMNQDGFLFLTQVLPWGMVQRYQKKPAQLEALVFGQAGLLSHITAPDEYALQLAKEHHFLSHKHALEEPLTAKAWNMLRLRPANFPGIRLGQFLAVLLAHEHLWSTLVACSTIKEFKEFFQQEPPAYWQQHYAPGKKCKQTFARIGEESIQNLLINVVAPLFIAYSRRTGDYFYQGKAIALLEQIPKENNKITRLYTGLGFANKSAADSQALIGLYQRYCQPKKCLNCVVGHRLMKQHLTRP